jgi:hypothetical protein
LAGATRTENNQHYLNLGDNCCPTLACCIHRTRTRTCARTLDRTSNRVGIFT